MEEILFKASRLEKPRTVSVPMRRGIYDILSRIAISNRCSVSCVVRAIVEDFCDRLPADQEVTGNE